MRALMRSYSNKRELVMPNQEKDPKRMPGQSEQNRPGQPDTFKSEPRDKNNPQGGSFGDNEEENNQKNPSKDINRRS